MNYLRTMIIYLRYHMDGNSFTMLKINDEIFLGNSDWVYLDYSSFEFCS